MKKKTCNSLTWKQETCLPEFKFKIEGNMQISQVLSEETALSPPESMSEVGVRQLDGNLLQQLQRGLWTLIGLAKDCRTCLL